MSVAEVNFTFDGLHCLRDFGCIFIADPTRIVSPKTNRPEYSIAGMSGTILMGDKATHEPYMVPGVLVPIKTPQSAQAAQQLARRVAAWLKTGRRVLSWDYEPMHQHAAEVVAAIEWETKTWMDGGLAVTFKVQPYTYDLTATVKQKTISAGTSTLLVPVSTGEPCPVSIKLTNTGSAAITRVRVATAAGKAVELAKGMSLAAGAMLNLTMEPPIGAAITSGGVTTNALRYAVKFDQLTLAGPENLTIEVDGAATVVATARGCML